MIFECCSILETHQNSLYGNISREVKNDEAIDIASFLDDPQLLMYGMTKKIYEIQRDPNLKSEDRTEAINNYKTKLDELKKKYLTSPSEGTDKNKDSSSSTSNGQ